MKRLMLVLFVALLVQPLAIVDSAMALAVENGTTNTMESREVLLNEYELTYEELELLLAQFGETPEDYDSLEELEQAIQFYQGHGEELEFISMLFAILGITEEEIKTFLLHVQSLDREMVEVSMNALEDRMLQFDHFEHPDDLTGEMKAELVSIWMESLEAFGLESRLFLEVNEQKIAVTIVELLEMERLNENRLIVELFNNRGVFLFDLILTDDLVDSGLFIDIASVMSGLPEMAHQFPTEVTLPETASSYGKTALLGLILLLLSLYAYHRRSVAQQ
ncbi:processed acidic surface protein [Alkalihalobacillus sp. LMS39]|uniref:processed acidic surface protein n=1 Tax=Alkalihalobacillus sp. LMS39 TaxID=2924032 RepID=UPI001FB53798|nr:processed acidic surface protein [Alkalihalobacillus sp. LMS39]UOE96024.1 processed acidic surface protein [Alkalihalobacillus sp. LMS39]